MTFSTACSIIYKLQQLSTKKEEQRRNGSHCFFQKVRYCVTWHVLRSDQDFNFYIQDEALKTGFLKPTTIKLWQLRSRRNLSYRLAQLLQVAAVGNGPGVPCMCCPEDPVGHGDL